MEVVNKKSSSEWCKHHGIDRGHIMDPDGWDRANLSESWDEVITEKEFRDRMSISTVFFSEAIDKFFGLDV